MPLAARVGDLHVCPLSTGSAPHVGGPVLAGCPTVLIANQPAARAGDAALCAGAPDAIAVGSPTVLIANQPAARQGDASAHGGLVVGGCTTVLIGVSPEGALLQAAAASGAAFCPDLGR